MNIFGETWEKYGLNNLIFIASSFPSKIDAFLYTKRFYMTKIGCSTEFWNIGKLAEKSTKINWILTFGVAESGQKGAGVSIKFLDPLIHINLIL